MQLKLKNFKQHASKTIDFPDKGMVLLKGISGAGKSTIFQAIDFAINGTQVKKSWNGGSPSVELDWPNQNIYILRTQTPGTLLVRTESGEFRDDAAQKEIYKKMCGSKKHFGVSSYIKQRMKGALINLGEADQLRLIQNLAFGEDDPEVIKSQIETVLKEKNAELLAQEKQTAAHNTNVSELKARADAAEVLIKDPEPPMSDKDMKKTSEAFVGCQKEKQELEVLLKSVIKAAANPLYITAATNKSAMLEFERQIMDSEQKLLSTKKAIKELESSRPDQPNIGQDLVDAKKAFLETRKRALAFLLEIKETYPEYSGGSVSVFLKNQIESLADFIQKASTSLTEALVEKKALEAAPEKQHCPECSAALLVKNGKIHKHENLSNDPEQIAAIYLKIDNINKELSALTKKNDQFQVSLAQSLAIKDDAAKFQDPLPETTKQEELEALQQAIDQFKEKTSKINTELFALNREISAIEQNINTCNSKIKALKKAEDDYSKLPPIEELRDKEAAICQDILKKDEQIKDLAALIEKIDQYNKDLQKNAAAKAVVSEIRAQQKIAEGRAKEHNKAVEAAKEAAGAWARIRELSNIAAVKAVEDIINNINDNAGVYLEKLFPDDGTSIRILNTTKTLKEEKPKLSLEIIHRGHDAGKNDEELSGGEQDRVALAFQLAMGDLYASPILMVDEGFAGADVEKTLHHGLSLLKDYSTDKLVCVIQHGAPEEFFDKVVYFE